MKFLGQFSLARRGKINKYLKKVDNNKYYSNFGPLYLELKKKIERNLNYKDNNVILTSSGHSSLLTITKITEYTATTTASHHVSLATFVCPWVACDVVAAWIVLVLITSIYLILHDIFITFFC